jgi:hypothetical protein
MLFSRVPQSDTYDISAVSVLKPLWLQDIQEAYAQDAAAQKLLSELCVHSTQGLYTLLDGLIKFKGRLWLGNSPTLQSKVFNSLHSSAVGGYSRFEVTYKCIKQLFAWPKLKQTIKDLVAQCTTCQQAKHERVAYPGLLSPLPIPNGA